MSARREYILPSLLRAVTILGFGAFLTGCPGDTKEQTRQDVDANFSNQPVGCTTAPCPAAVPLVRFVDDGGVPTTTSATVKNTLEISNLVTTTQLPAGFTDVSTDRDNFKVEVLDATATGNTIPAAKVEVEALKRDHSSFSPPRKITVELQRVGTSQLFRSKYLRLVVDDVDNAANAAQTLLTDWDPSDENVEILGQIVKVKYTAASGPVTAETTVGNANRKYIQVVCHVLKSNVTGAGVVTTAQATTRIKKWYRRLYAQISMAPKLLLTRLIDPVENLISISNATGAVATGGAASKISFSITTTRPGTPATTVTQAIGPYTPPAGHTPMQTANDLAALIRAPALAAALLEFFNPIPAAALRAGAPFTVRTVQNPLLVATHPNGSADLVIVDPAGGKVTITALVQTDATQTVTVGRVNPDTIESYDGVNGSWVVGSIQFRTVLQTYDTGSDRMDIVVAGALSSGDRGQSLVPGTNNYPAPMHAIAQIKMSAFHASAVMDGTDNSPFSLPHETGHAMLDANHVAADNTQMMMGNGTSATNAVGASKRISEAAIGFDLPASNIDQEARIRSQGAAVHVPFV